MKIPPLPHTPSWRGIYLSIDIFLSQFWLLEEVISVTLCSSVNTNTLQHKEMFTLQFPGMLLRSKCHNQGCYVVQCYGLLDQF
jgi:hypothetical protein